MDDLNRAHSVCSQPPSNNILTEPFDALRSNLADYEQLHQTIFPPSRRDWGLIPPKLFTCVEYVPKYSKMTRHNLYPGNEQSAEAFHDKWKDMLQLHKVPRCAVKLDVPSAEDSHPSRPSDGTRSGAQKARRQAGECEAAEEQLACRHGPPSLKSKDSWCLSDVPSVQERVKESNPTKKSKEVQRALKELPPPGATIRQVGKVTTSKEKRLRVISAFVCKCSEPENERLLVAARLYGSGTDFDGLPWNSKQWTDS